MKSVCFAWVSLIATLLSGQPVQSMAQDGGGLNKSTVERCQAPRRAVTMTHIHALPGQRENLKRYILTNWFAIDAAAVRAGLMKSFAIWEKEKDSGAESWDFIVVDTWCDERGHDGVSSQFALFSKAHRSIAVEGKHFEQLGRRGESKSMIEESSPLQKTS
jgi:hypothetical protein